MISRVENRALKPMAMTTAECDRMIAEAKKQKLVISTYHNRHWDGCILTAVRKIKEGVIGDIIRIEAHMGGYGQPKDWWRSNKAIPQFPALTGWLADVFFEKARERRNALITDSQGNLLHGHVCLGKGVVSSCHTLPYNQIYGGDAVFCQKDTV